MIMWWPVGTAAAAIVLAALQPSGSVLARYDFDAPPADRWELPKLLGEISGLAVDRSGRLFAHDDERAVIYQLDPKAHRVVKLFAFGKPAARGDFEAIAILGDRFVLSTSDGVLYEGREGRDGESVPFVTRRTGVGDRCEVEGVAAESSAGGLLLACKTPRTASIRERLAVYRWSLQQQTLDPTPRLLTARSRVTQPLNLESFRPSEIVREPASGHVLLLAGPERAIAELSSSGALVGTARLRSKLHRQPEGLVVTADGSLIVSDEAAGRRATITVYRPAR
jgi:hypothetical protein